MGLIGYKCPQCWERDCQCGGGKGAFSLPPIVVLGKVSDTSRRDAALERIAAALESRPKRRKRNR